ncbi:MAG: hypothetical protein ACE15C_03055 [Phycisphaerae bacterium]
MAKKVAVAAAACLLAISIGLGEVQTVKLKNGAEYTGDVTKTADGYQVRLPGGSIITVGADQVDKIGAPVDRMPEYKLRLSRIDPRKAEDHVALAEWANSVGLLEQAREQLVQALEIDRNNVKAGLLLRQVEAIIGKAPPPGTKPATGPATRTPATVVAIDNKMFVSDQDIYHIRLEELRKDDRVAVEFKRNLIDRFVKYMQGRNDDFKVPQAGDKFKALPAIDQALYIRDELEREANQGWKDDIIIKTDPKFMIDFRNKVWPFVATNCATSNCHGGDKVRGGLKLYNLPAANEKVDYTNFVLLDGYRNAAGRMINRDRIDDSLLLQYLLPPDQAKFSHSTKINPLVDSRDSAVYRAGRDWIAELKPPPHPDYRLTYQPPAGMKLQFIVEVPFPTPEPTSRPK